MKRYRFSIDCSNTGGEFHVSLIGHFAGVDLDAELRALTRVLTAAGYHVDPDPDPEGEFAVRARLLSAR